MQKLYVDAWSKVGHILDLVFTGSY